MHTILQDLRYAVRSLRRTPAITLTALITLALAIGANTALFSLINGVFFAPPPGVQQAAELVRVSHVSPEFRDARPVGLSYADYLTLRDSSGVFSDLAAFAPAQVAVAAGGDPEQVGAELVTGQYFSTLRIRPALGRGVLPEENVTPGEHPVAVISNDLWQRRFGAADALGRQVMVNGAAFTIIGVAPEGFRGLGGLQAATDLWVPVMMHDVVRPDWSPFAEPTAGYQPFEAVGRLRQGVSAAQAQGVMETLLSRMEAEYPEAYAGVSASLFPLGGAFKSFGSQLPMLLMALGVTLIILLIACANLANLLLARAARRRREIAIRTAVGASRRRIVQQLLTESLLLAAGGGAAGVWTAILMVDLFHALAPLPYPLPMSLDATTLLVTGGMTVLTGVLVGLSPALRASSTELTPVLKADGGGGGRRIGPQNVLVAGQVALSFMLLVGAALLVRSMWDVLAVAHTQPSRDETLVLTVDLHSANYEDEAQLAFVGSLMERLRGMPGVESASVMSLRPQNWGPSGVLVAREGTADADQDRSQRPWLLQHRVWPDFFRATGLALLRGRDFAPSEGDGSPGMVIVNETAARTLWPGEDPLGKRLRVNSDTLPWSTVIAVAADAGFDRPRDANTLPAIYLSALQEGPGNFLAGVHVRGGGIEDAFVRNVRDQISALDPGLPILSVQTLGELIDQKYAEGWLAGGMLLACGALAFGLALIGLHGLVAYTVVQRTREISIRMSLGASRSQVLGLFGRDVLRISAVGLGIGLILAGGITLLLSRMLSWIRPADTLLFAAVAAFLLLVALLASYFPARRATRVDPMVALRAE